MGFLHNGHPTYVGMGVYARGGLADDAFGAECAAFVPYLAPAGGLTLDEGMTVEATG